MELRHLRYFLVLAETLSFTHAAEAQLIINTLFGQTEPP